MLPPPSAAHVLSRSAFADGLHCQLKFWLNRKKAVPQAKQTSLQKWYGQKAGRIAMLARDLFPGGQAAYNREGNYAAAVQHTYNWILEGRDVIYDAAFQAGGMLAIVDILVRQGSRWNAYEVKSSSSVREHHLADLAWQQLVMTRAELSLSGIFIIHLNTGYVLHGAVNPHDLFKIVSVKKAVEQKIAMISQKADELIALAEQEEKPDPTVGPRCFSRESCDYRTDCWSNIPNPSVFDIAHLESSRKFELYGQGILHLEEIPEDFALTEAQQLQVRSFLQQSIHTNRPALELWMGSLVWPLFFMDFECFQPGIPIYQLTRPFQQIPFQFSVHLLRNPHDEPRHFSFLGSPQPDPRETFLKKLLEATGEHGTVLVYDQASELARLKDLAEDFPHYRKPVRNLMGRIRDLMEPFQKRWFYAPGMQGLYSIKQVFPALFPDRNYQGLAIADGQTASMAFESLLWEKDPGVAAQIHDSLLQYSRQDTEAMVLIWKRLYGELTG